MNSNSDPLPLWSAMVSARATQLHAKDQAKAIASNLRQAGLAIDAPTVQYWLSGTSAPATPAEHSALMAALNLNYQQAAKAQLTPVQTKMAEYRTQVEQLFARITPEMKQVATRSAVLARPGESRRSHGSAQISQYHDHAALRPLRLHHGGTPYEELSESTLRGYLRDTGNAHEYLRCHRILKGWLQHDMRKKIGPGYPHIEAGFNRPSLELQERIHAELFAGDDAAFRHFEDLIIQNRLAVVSDLRKKEPPCEREIEKELRSMPRRYWQACLDHFLGLNQSEAAWPLEPIETQGQYLRTLRRAMGWKTVDVGAAIGKGTITITDIEVDRLPMDGEDSCRTQLGQYYAARLSAMDSPYYQQARMEELPIGGWEEKPRDYWLAAVRKLIDPEGYKAQPPTAHWASYVPDLASQGAYFYAMRRALHLKDYEVAEACGTQRYAIQQIERDSPTMTATAKNRARMHEFYEKAQAKFDKPLYSATIMHRLPIAREEPEQKRT